MAFDRTFPRGPAGAVAGVPGDSTTFYFGSMNGGIWKTTDAGVVWTPIFDGHPVASIGALAVAPSDPKIIYAGTGESDIREDLSSGDGVYRSTDGGATWNHIGLEDTRQISRIVIDPQNPNVLYVGAQGHAFGPNEQRGIYKTVDVGGHWTRVLDLLPEIGISDLAMASSDPQLLFAGAWHVQRPPCSASWRNSTNACMRPTLLPSQSLKSSARSNRWYHASRAKRVDAELSALEIPPE